jgi:hypothetical protein
MSDRKEYFKKYWEENKGTAELRHLVYLANRDKILENQARWRAAKKALKVVVPVNRTVIQERNRAFYEKNKEKILAAAKERRAREVLSIRGVKPSNNQTTEQIQNCIYSRTYYEKKKRKL